MAEKIPGSITEGGLVFGSVASNELVVKLEQTVVKMGRMRRALAFYADTMNYRQAGWQGDPDPPEVMKDYGERAREVLDALEQAEEKVPK